MSYTRALQYSCSCHGAGGFEPGRARIVVIRRRVGTAWVEDVYSSATVRCRDAFHRNPDREKVHKRKEKSPRKKTERDSVYRDRLFRDSKVRHPQAATMGETSPIWSARETSSKLVIEVIDPAVVLLNRGCFLTIAYFSEGGIANVYLSAT